MEGKYHFECLNPACDWGTDVTGKDEVDATHKAMDAHDQHWISLTKGDAGNPRICPAEHYTLLLPSGELKEY